MARVNVVDDPIFHLILNKQEAEVLFVILCNIGGLGEGGRIAWRILSEMEEEYKFDDESFYNGEYPHEGEISFPE
jgi:hypothetical protein